MGGGVTPDATQCGVTPGNPCKPQPYVTGAVPTSLEVGSGWHNFQGTIQNQAVDEAAGGAVTSLTCTTSSVQVSCELIETPDYVDANSTVPFTASVRGIGRGVFTVTLSVTLTNEGGSRSSTRAYTTTVTGNSIFTFTTPAKKHAMVQPGGTLRATIDSAYEFFSTSVASSIDGLDRTSQTTAGTVAIALGLGGLNLSRGSHTWTLYGCVDGGRCDQENATFFYNAPPPPSPDSSQVVAERNVFPVEDLVPPAQAGGDDDWLVGALPLPPLEQRGCPATPGAPEINLLDPVGRVLQFGAAPYPTGFLFRAQEMRRGVVIKTIAIDHPAGDSASTCGHWGFYGPEDFYYQPAECDDPRWNSYPYGDRPFHGCALGQGAPVAPSARSGAPGSSGPQLAIAAGAIDTASYEIYLNERMIYPEDELGGPGVPPVSASINSSPWASFTIPDGHPGIQMSEWNEVVVSVADQSGNRTAVRGRFIARPSEAKKIVQATYRADRDLTRRSTADCAAFGLVQCDEIFLTQTVPGFASRDRDRSLHLIYRSGGQRQRLTLPVRALYPLNAAPPDSFWTFASIGGVQSGPTLRFAGTAGTVGGPGAWPLSPTGNEDRMFGAELDPGTGALLSKRVTVTLRTFKNGASLDRTVIQDVVNPYLTDTLTTRFGAGWQLAEYSRLLPGEVLGADSIRVWLLGDGSMLTFRKPGTTWIAPAGASVRLWEIPADSVPFRLTPPDGTVLAFYADGRPAWIQDQLGARTRFVHSDGRLTSIVAPNGARFLLTYNAGGRVSLIQAASGGATRNVLAMVYDGNGRPTEMIVHRSEAAGDTTRYTYASTTTGAFLTSVTTPARPTGPAPVTTILYDSLGWSPIAIVRPLFSGRRDTTYYRSAWRLTVPGSYQGRKPGLAPFAPVRREFYRGGSMDVSGRVTEFTVDRFGAPTWVRRRAPASNVLQPDGSLAAPQGDEVRTITRDTTGRVLEVVTSRDADGLAARVRYHYSPLYQMVDSIWRTSRAYPAPAGPDSLDLETFVYDSVSLGTVGGLGAGSDGRCYRMLSSKDALGITNASVQYMSTGRQLCLPWKVTGYGAGNVTTFAYNGGLAAGSRPTSVTDPLGLITSVTYDPTTWNTASVTVPATGTSTIGYNPFGEPVTSVTGDTATTIIARDYSGRDTASRTGLGPVAKKYYGRDGLVDSVAIYQGVVAEGSLGTTGTPQVTRSYYNVFGLADSTVGPGRLPGQGGSGIFGRVQRVRYTRDLQPDTTWVGNGAFTTNVYDWAGRNIRAIQSPVTTATTAFADDSVRTLYNFTSGVQAGIHLSPGQRTETWYDPRGRVQRSRTIDNRLGRVAEHRYGYTPSGAVLVDSLMLADSVALVRRFTYDRLGRRLVSGDTLRRLGGTGSVTGDTTGRQVYSYNSTSQLLESITGYGSASGTPFGAVNWTYDVGGREILRGVQLNGGSNRLWTSTTYTSIGMLDSIRTSWGASAAGGTVWYRFGRPAYSLAGDLQSYVERINTNGMGTDSASVALEYTPDHARRLSQSRREVSTSWSQYNWTYDAFNNRLAQLASGSAGDTLCVTADTSSFGADNRLLRSGPALVTPNCSLVHRYWYDNAGNRIVGLDTMEAGGGVSGQRSVMTYTAGGQLYFSITPAPLPATWPTYGASWTWYDGSGLRAVSKEETMPAVYPLPDTTLTGPWTWYIYDGGQLALTATRSGNNWSIGGRQLAGGIDAPLVLRTGGGPVALVSDRQGSFQTAVKPDGTWDNSFAVIAANLFGERDGAIRGTGGSSAGAGFSGAGTSASGAGFVYLRNRWYDPQTGRFLTQDPIGMAGGVNLYAYAGNNPVAYSDPFGLCTPMPWCLMSAGRNASAEAGEALGVITPVADVAAGLMPGVSTVQDGATLMTGTNPITGERVGLGGRGLAAVGLLTPATGGELRAGAAAVERIGAKLSNVLSHLDRSHLSIAGRELRGLATGWDHVTEVREAAQGARNLIGRLKGILGNPELDAAARAEAQGLLGRASRAADAAERVVGP